MAQQTAVEWFCNKLSDLDTRPRETLQILEWYEQAKQMEKEHIAKAWDAGYYGYFSLGIREIEFNNGEEYYEENYKNK